jgi:hypothetical protein
VSAYEAFGRGDVPAILELLTDDIDWSSEAASTAAPWFGVKHGKAGVVTFFETFGAAIEVLDFTPVSFTSNDTDVMALIRYRGKVRATGKEVAMNLHHYWTFRDGKIAYYRGSEDTAQTLAALQA